MHSSSPMQTRGACCKSTSAVQRVRQPSTGYGSGQQWRGLGRRRPIDAMAPARSNGRGSIGGTGYGSAGKRRQQEKCQRRDSGGRRCAEKCSQLHRADGGLDIHLKGFLAGQHPVRTTHGIRRRRTVAVSKRSGVKMRISRDRKRCMYVQASLFRSSEMAVQKRA